jgi:DNA polymerase I-like protein with 3'-5' exonuclease and polymerase domains
MREIVTSLDAWEEIQTDHWGQSFAFDFETTGLSFMKDKVCGLAITFENLDSYYLVFQHTFPEEAEVVEQYTERVLDGYDEEHYETPKKKLKKSRLVPRYVDIEQERTVTTTVYPTREVVNTVQASELLNYMFAQEVEVIVAHNAKFDLHFLDQIRVEIGDNLADTMLAAKLIDENRLVGLKELAPLAYMQLTTYQDLEHYPGFNKNEFLGVPLELGGKYAMMDTEATWKLWKIFEHELIEEGVDSAFYDIWMPTLRVLQEMEHKGVAVDLDRVRELKEKYGTILAEADDKIMRIGLEMVNKTFNHLNAPKNYVRMLTPTERSRYEASDALYATIETDEGYNTLAFKPTPRSDPRALTFNPGSNDHLARLFYDWLKLKPPEGVKLAKTNDGRPVDKNMLKMWEYGLGEDCPEVLRLIQDRRQAEKFIGTYLDRLLNDTDPTDNNCIRASFNQHITDTGRLSSSYPNLQNIPSRGDRGKEARELFVARPNHQLVVADYSSMELIIASNYAAEYLIEKKKDPDHTMLIALRDNMDLHALTASNQFNVDYDDLLADIAEGSVEAKLRRMIGKTSNFGLLYGMGAKKFQVYLWTETGQFYPLKQVEGFIKAFEDTYADVTAWKKHEIEQLHFRGYVETLGGRKRRLPKIWSNDRYEVMHAERQGVNAKVQGTCADIILGSLQWIQDQLRRIDGYLLLQVHDELVGETPNDHVQHAIEVIEEGMVRHINDSLLLPLTAKAHAGRSWGEAK